MPRPTAPLNVSANSVVAQRISSSVMLRYATIAFNIRWLSVRHADLQRILSKSSVRLTEELVLECCHQSAQVMRDNPSQIPTTLVVIYGKWFGVVEAAR